MKKERLSCERARSICIVKSLAKLGHFPSRTTEKEAWFLSPLRSETQASFKVSKVLNRWYDFGIGKGGNLIDLVCRIKDCSVKEALHFLDEDLSTYTKKSNTFIKIHRKAKNEIIRTRKIINSRLLTYLQARGIPLTIANTYCREVWYTCNGKSYFALGLENNAGGWELRNPYCKTSTSPKSYTFLQQGHPSQLVVVEGMFDLLSLAVLFPAVVLEADLLVLNSLSFTEEIQSVASSYTTTELFLDNDAAGKRAAAILEKSLTNCSDRSNLYKGHKDLNEKVISNTVHHLF